MLKTTPEEKIDSKPSKATAQKKTLTTFEGSYIPGTGRRKRAVATVRLYKGKGEMLINGKPSKEYFMTLELQQAIIQPLEAIGKIDAYDISVKVVGGGYRGQADAIRHAIARAIVESSEELRTTLKKLGFLRRDPRKKERKKYGLKRARRAPQFSKR